MSRNKGLLDMAKLDAKVPSAGSAALKTTTNAHGCVVVDLVSSDDEPTTQRKPALETAGKVKTAHNALSNVSTPMHSAHVAASTDLSPNRKRKLTEMLPERTTITDNTVSPKKPSTRDAPRSSLTPAKPIRAIQHPEAYSGARTSPATAKKVSQPVTPAKSRESALLAVPRKIASPLASSLEKKPSSREQSKAPSTPGKQQQGQAIDLPTRGGNSFKSVSRPNLPSFHSSTARKVSVSTQKQDLLGQDADVSGQAVVQDLDIRPSESLKQPAASQNAGARPRTLFSKSTNRVTVQPPKPATTKTMGTSLSKVLTTSTSFENLLIVQSNDSRKDAEGQKQKRESSVSAEDSDDQLPLRGRRKRKPGAPLPPPPMLSTTTTPTINRLKSIASPGSDQSSPSTPSRFSSRNMGKKNYLYPSSRSLSEVTHDSRAESSAPALTTLTLAHAEWKLQTLMDEFHTAHNVNLSHLLAHQRKGFAVEQSVDEPWIQTKCPFNIEPTKESESKHVGTIKFLTNDKMGGNSSAKKTVYATHYTAKAIEVPPYAHYSRLAANLLTENDKTLLVYPVGDENAGFADESLYNDLRDLYSHGNPDTRDAVIKQLERCKQLRPIIEEFLTSIDCTTGDVLRFYIAPLKSATRIASVPAPQNLQKKALKEPTFTSSFKSFEDWESILVHLEESDQETQERVRIACAAVQNAFDFSLWSFLEQKALELLSASPTALLPSSNTHGFFSCRLCHVYDCARHGNFNKLPLTNDLDLAEKRKFGTAVASQRSELHVEQEESAQDHPLGTNFKHRVRSSAHRGLQLHLHGEEQALRHSRLRAKTETSLNPHSDQSYKKCSKTCALDVKAMNSEPFTDIEKTLNRFDAAEREAVRSVLPAFLHTPNGSCLVARMLQKRCDHVFHLMAALEECHPTIAPSDVPPSQTEKPAKRSAQSYAVLATHASEQHEMPPFYPCHHAGSCESAVCSCFVNGIVCEKSCGCANACTRRFTGCGCARMGTICWQNPSCACWAMSRECDPDLCDTCGAFDALLPQNRFDEATKAQSCANVGIQRGLPRRLIVGQSQLSGFGLWAGEAIKKHAFLGEYKGEILSNAEAERRKTLYQHEPREYTFELNLTQELDGTHAGNKIRFINNSRKHKNCRAYLLLCGGVSRLGLFAERNIQPGEEILFEYGYPDEKLAGYKDLDAAVVVKSKKAKKAKRNPIEGLLAPNKAFGVFVEGSSRSSPSTHVDEDGASDSDTAHPLDKKLEEILEKQGNEEDDEDYQDTDTSGKEGHGGTGKRKRRHK